MEPADLLDPSYRRVTQVCGALVAIAGMATLAGWALEQPILSGLRASYIPMAPNTALAFITLGGSLFLLAGGWRGGRRVAGLGAVLVCLIGVLRASEYAQGVEFAVDQWFIRVRVGRLGLAPLGKMSLPTALAFLAAGTGVLTLAWPFRWNPSGHTTGACGAVAGTVGLVFSLGYGFSPSSPLLYGTDAIPMALNTALCFGGLGIGLAAAAGPRAFPLLRLSGPSIQARLLRIFLPLVVGTVGLVAWLTLLVTKAAGPSSAAISSAALATAAIVLVGAICERIAGRVGGQIERAETELQRAHDQLESKVEERTRELSRTNGRLAEALGDIQRAHKSLQQAHHELKQMQSRMIQQARMASLGQTAAGVAHEINNPLAFVSNNLVILKREVGEMHDVLRLYQQAEDTLAEYRRDLYLRICDLAEEVDLPFVLENLDDLLERSRAGLLRIQKIVADLGDFAHLEQAEFQAVDLNAGISTTVRLMRNLADQRQVALETDLNPTPRTTCFPVKINLVVQSLITNAIDASHPGGRVLITTRQFEEGSEIEVVDDGRGIDPAIRDRIFDPFFTTKPVGQGTGLGLALSYGIVKDHGGTIEFESKPGEGARFTIRLPVSPPAEIFAQVDGADGSEATVSLF